MTRLDRRTFLAAGAAVVVAACSNTTASSGPGLTTPQGLPIGTIQSSHGAITSVGMVGDSITEGSADVLRTAFTTAGVDDVHIDGKHSRRIEVGNGNGDAPLSGIRTLYNMLAEGVNPSAWVMELGTNDVGSYANADEYGKLIDQITAMIPNKPLVWVNTYRKQYLDATVVFNTVVAERMQARGNAAVADWFTVASAPDQTVLRGDHLHPNENGQLALSLLVVQALRTL